METVFENTYTDSVEIIAEINRKVWDPKRVLWGRDFLAISFFFAVIMVWSKSWYWGFAAAACAAYGVYNLYYHQIWAYDLVRKIKKKNNGLIPSATVTVTDKFIWQYQTTTISFPFFSLKYAYFLKHTIRMVSEDNAYMTFQRSGFTKGSPEELEKFISEKCPRAQIIHKE